MLKELLRAIKIITIYFYQEKIAQKIDAGVRKSIGNFQFFVAFLLIFFSIYYSR
jgi:hypothetical protein